MTSVKPTGLQLRSTVKPEGILELSLAAIETPKPEGDEVLVRMEASPLTRAFRRWRASKIICVPPP